ncbi:MAG: peptidylprolyl isomerase [Cytophagaceae bacterium]|nr:peptidylprolyl isomerase [Cytophagaceae bacterium]
MSQKRFQIYIFLLLTTLYSCQKIIKTAPVQVPQVVELQKEPPIIIVNQNEISKNDLIEDIINNAEFDSLSNDEIINEIIKRKLLILEGQSRGMDTMGIFKEEVETYNKVTLEKYLIDKKALEKLRNEIYENYKIEINASHIFVPLSAYASPEDTLKIYQELMDLRDFAKKKDNFPSLAKEWSKDQKNNNKGGALGWFSTLHLIYPLEKIAHSTPKDSISLPVRTRMGYHLLKVNDKRPNSGYVKVQHIFKHLKSDVSKESYDRTYTFLDSLKYVAEKVGNFNELVHNYSDDYNSKENNGILPVFGIGTREESTFEEAAFSLQIGQISKPFRSVSGLHILKLIEKYPPDDKNTYLKRVESKLTTDSRGEYLLDERIKKIKKNFKFSVNEELLEQVQNYFDDRILKRTWKSPNTDLNGFVLFFIEDNRYMVSDFLKYVEEHQEYEKWNPEETPYTISKMLFEKYTTKLLLNYEESVEINNNPELQRVFKLEKENLMISKIMNERVIQKSISDTTGQKSFFKNNPNLFPPKETGEMISVSFDSEETQKKFYELKQKSKPYQLHRGIKPMYFNKNEFELNNETKRKLIGLINIMRKNPGYIVEIGGHSDANEEDRIAELRIKNTVNYLVSNGLPLTRILEVNFNSSKPAERFDWQKNQRVSFQFFSNYESDLAKVFIEKNPNSILYLKYQVTKAEFEKKMGLKWGNQSGSIKNNGRVEEFTLKVKATGANFKDYRYDVIEKYQIYLENDLLKTLSRKFELNFDKKEFSKLLEEIKKQ